MSVRDELTIARPGRVVEQNAARRDLLQVARIRLRVHGDHDVDGARTREIAVLADADLVPRRQSLDVRREEILAADGHAHPKDGLHQQRVGARRAGAVDVRDLEDEVVYPAFLLLSHSSSSRRASSLAYGIVTVDFCMSQAPVGQRSAHSPQCTHRFSSFSITRAVCLSGAGYEELLLGFEPRRLQARSTARPRCRSARSRGNRRDRCRCTRRTRCTERAVNTVCKSQFRQRSTSVATCSALKPSSTSMSSFLNRLRKSTCGMMRRAAGS